MKHGAAIINETLLEQFSHEGFLYVQCSNKEKFNNNKMSWCFHSLVFLCAKETVW